MKQSRPRKKFGLVAGILSLMMATSLALMLNSSLRESAIMDELAHIPAGYSYVRFGDFRLNPEHPPLLKALSAIPLLFVNLRFPTDAMAWTTDVNGQWDIGMLFLYQSGNNADLIIQLSRAAPMILTLFLIFFAWFFSKRIMGEKWALIPAAFIAFSPTFLAHGHYVTTDVASALGALTAIYFFIKAVEKNSWQNLCLAGIFFGIAQLIKFSMLLLVPYFMLLAVIWGTARALRSDKPMRAKVWTAQMRLQLKNLTIIFAIGCALIYPVYAIFTANYPIEKQVSDTKFLLNSFIQNGGIGGIVAETTVKMAENKITRPYAQYMLGALMVSQRVSGGNIVYFMGEISESGWRSYFPIVYVLKEPLPLVILSLIVLGVGIFTLIKRLHKVFAKFPEAVATRFAEIALGIFILTYAVISIKSPLNIGVRHLIPILPFIYILSVETIRIGFGKAAKPLVAVALVWLGAGTIFASPHYISYFNEIGGGKWSGYRYVTDSNYDWGQDLKRLAKFARENNIDKIAVDYFGGGSPTYYIGKDRVYYWRSSKGNPANEGIKWFALSINTLQQAKACPMGRFERKKEDTYQWLKNPYKPYARVGTSIFVYKLAE